MGEALRNAAILTRPKRQAASNGSPDSTWVTRQFQARRPQSRRWSARCLRDVLAVTGVVSLAERADDMLMWGYYADSHRGYCLEFSTDKEPFLLANRVKYAEERPVFRLFDTDRTGLMERLLLQKASFWQHEREWRIARMQGVGPMEFAPECLTAIILGANISRDEESTLRQMASGQKHPIAIKRASLDERTFKLTILDA